MPLNSMSKIFFKKRKEYEIFEEFLFLQVREVLKKNSGHMIKGKKLCDLRYTVIDVETTGFNPKRCEIIALGAVSIEGTKVMKNRIFDRLICPHCRVPEEVENLTKLKDYILISCSNFYGVVVDFLEFISDSIIVGHSVTFDIAFINCKLQKKFKCKLKNYFLDIKTIAQALQLPVRSYSLDDLLEYYKIKIENRHVAIEDAMATAELFVLLLNNLNKNGVLTLSDLELFMGPLHNMYRHRECVFGF